MIGRLKTTKKKMSNLRKKEARYGYLFILPWIIGFLGLFIRPAITSIRYAFNKTKFTATGVQFEFIGFKNFTDPFTNDPKFITDTFGAGLSTFTYETLLAVIFSLFIALILNQKFRGRTVARALFFLPVIIASGVVIQVLRMYGIDTNMDTENSFVFQGNGLITILETAGFPEGITIFLQNISNHVFEVVWLSGIQIILYLSGLQSIPSSEYEAAKIEGATAWECFWKITWVRISPMTLVVVVYSIIDSFTNVANKLIRWSYEKYLTDNDWGQSSAFGWVSAVAALIVLVIVGGLVSRSVFYVSED